MTRNRWPIPFVLGLALAYGTRGAGAGWDEPIQLPPLPDPEVTRTQAPPPPAAPRPRTATPAPAPARPVRPVPARTGTAATASAPVAPAASAGPGYAAAAPAAAVAPSPFAAAAASAGSAAAPAADYAYFPQMLGDLGPTPNLQRFAAFPTPPTIPQPFPPPRPPTAPSPRQASALVPSVRGMKIAENQSPRPQDRIFFSFNYFSDVNGPLNRRFEAPVSHLRVYREIFGFEKTFDDGNGSIGIRLPLNTLQANSTIQGNFNKPGGTSTSLNDLSVFAKYILKQDLKTGSLISVGLDITPTTGPGAFAGAPYLSTIHTTFIQPFVGYIWNPGRFYLHGFSAFDFPVSPTQASFLYNDVGVGYFVYRDKDARHFLTAVAPTFEVHVTTPLNHRDVTNPDDPGAAPDVVNLTYGISFEFHRRGLLTFGYAAPITGPRPFDGEALVLFNLRFGTPRRALPPVISG